MQGITNRWVQHILPWVEVKGGTYRVNRRLSYSVGDGRVDVEQTGDRVSIIPAELGEFPALRGYDDGDVLAAVAGRFARRELDSGTVLAQAGAPVEEILVIVHGRLSRAGANAYGDDRRLGVVADGDYLGAGAMTAEQATWDVTVTALTPCTVLALSRADFRAAVDQSGSLRDHLREFSATLGKKRSRGGEASLQLAAGHGGDYEPVLPATFVNYEAAPREYELSVAQTVLRVHSRVADLFNAPMNQIEHQIKLTVQELRERQEHELINNSDFGLLHNVDYTQRMQPADGAPGPDDLDELLTRRRDSRYLLAHPRAIAAFGRECNKRGLYPASVPMGERMVPAWRGVPSCPARSFRSASTTRPRSWCCGRAKRTRAWSACTRPASPTSTSRGLTYGSWESTIKPSSRTWYPRTSPPRYLYRMRSVCLRTSKSVARIRRDQQV